VHADPADRSPASLRRRDRGPGDVGREPPAHLHDEAVGADDDAGEAGTEAQHGKQQPERAVLDGEFVADVQV
jgi:hypothetical protein